MAQLEQLTWNMGDIHTYTNDGNHSHPTASLFALSQSVVSSSHWKVVGSNIDSGSYPSLILAPKSTSSSYSQMRVVLITGDITSNASGPHASDMAANATTANWASYDPMLYVGIAPFAGSTAHPNHIATASGGDWRHGEGGGKIWPWQARFSGWMSVVASESGAHLLQGGGDGTPLQDDQYAANTHHSGGIFIIENEEMLYVQINQDYTAHSENSNGLFMAGAMFIPYSTTASHGSPGRMFGIAQGADVGVSGYTPFRTSNDPPTDIDATSDTRFWPGSNTVTNDGYGNRHYAWDSASLGWVQLETLKHYSDFIDDEWAIDYNVFRDASGQQILLPLHAFQLSSPHTAMGYWRQVTQVAKVYTRAVITDTQGNIKGYCIQKATQDTFTTPGYFLHNDRTFT